MKKKYAGINLLVNRVLLWFAPQLACEHHTKLNRNLNVTVTGLPSSDTNTDHIPSLTKSFVVGCSGCWNLVLMLHQGLPEALVETKRREERGLLKCFRQKEYNAAALDGMIQNN